MASNTTVDVHHGWFARTAPGGLTWARWPRQDKLTHSLGRAQGDRFRRSIDDNRGMVRVEHFPASVVEWRRTPDGEGVRDDREFPPASPASQVIGVLEMLSTLTLTTDWGEAMESHPSRGDGKGKVLAMATPYEGFVQR